MTKTGSGRHGHSLCPRCRPHPPSKFLLWRRYRQRRSKPATSWTTAYFEIDAADDEPAEWGGRLYVPLRRRGHNKEGRDSQPQVIVALAVTRDGMPVRSWVLPGDTADVATVARIKEDLRAWRLGRCVFVGDAGMYSAANLLALSRGLGRYILATPLRKLSEIEAEVLSRPGRYKPVADNLQVKEVVVGDGERRRRYVLCLNPQEASASAGTATACSMNSPPNSTGSRLVRPITPKRPAHC